MSTLSRVIGTILQSERTMGTGRVTAFVRPGEVRLADREERVLVAGGTMPIVGESIPWVRVDGNTLVTGHNLPQMAPHPVSLEVVQIPIYLSAELLYGDELDVGWHCYAASFAPEEGGAEVDPRVEWIRTRSAPAPLAVPSPECVLGGGFEYNFFYDHYLCMTFFDPAGGGETDPGPWISVYGGLWGLEDGDMFSISLRLPSSGLPRNGGVRVYHAWHDVREPGELGPFHRCFEFAGSLEPGYDIYDHLDVVITSPDPEGEEPPDTNTLALRRVGIMVGLGDADEAERAGLSKVLIYRSVAQGSIVDPPPAIGYVGEVALPLTLVQTRFHWIDDTGPDIGSPPALPWGNSE